MKTNVYLCKHQLLFGRTINSQHDARTVEQYSTAQQKFANCYANNSHTKTTIFRELFAYFQS